MLSAGISARRDGMSMILSRHTLAGVEAGG
jgi:hypothetical protein